MYSEVTAGLDALKKTLVTYKKVTEVFGWTSASLIIHHATKADSKVIRGSSGILAACDCMILAEGQEEDRTETTPGADFCCSEQHFRAMGGSSPAP